MSEVSAHPSEITVQPNGGAKRIEARVDGDLSGGDDTIEGDDVGFTPTFVPPELWGRGRAETLVRAALAWAEAGKRRRVPACSYGDTFGRWHPEFS
jgi:hypothetical protein